jgi:ureidoacrylate peracid hydrolase
VSGLADWIAPGRTAVLVVDMQVDFASPDGVLGAAGVDLSAVPAALAAAERLVAAARSAGALVIFVALSTSPSTDSPAWAEQMWRRGDNPEAEASLCRAGRPGAAFFGPQPEAGDVVIYKRRYSGFFGTALHQTLDDLGVDTLVICGLTTECCVDCTARDAFHLDYHVFIAADACAAYAPDLHTAALKALALNCAIIIDTEAAIAAWVGAN